MPRTLLFNRAVALHARRQQVALSWRSFSTSKPSKGDKEKRERKKSSDISPGSASKQPATTAGAASSRTKGSLGKKRNSKAGKELPPILIEPGKKQSLASLPNPPFDRTHSETNSEETHGLWAVNCSPFLDPQDFCRKSAFYEETPTRNGTLAARRLLEGKERLLDTLHSDIVRSTGKKGSNPQPYVILGHGVPRQLLQSHVNMAHFLFSRYDNAPEISFKSSTGKLAVDTLRIRSPHPKGNNKVERWTFPEDSDVDHEMQLYLAVMNRISTNLSAVLWKNAIPAAVENVDEQEDEDDDFVLTDSSSAAARTPLYWNVDLIRGTENPLYSFLVPIVDWTLPENDSEPGRMTIRLRGLSKSPATQGRKRRPKPIEVTMIFRASFQNPAAPK